MNKMKITLDKKTNNFCLIYCQVLFSFLDVTVSNRQWNIAQLWVGTRRFDLYVLLLIFKLHLNIHIYMNKYNNKYNNKYINI